MEVLAVMLFALAVSADGFMVGMAYGIKRIRIPVSSLLVISIASTLAVTVSMACGKILTLFLDPSVARFAGAIILIVIGLYFFLQYGKEKISDIACAAEEPLWSLNIRSLGIIIHILKEPAMADFDRSGEISTKEAFFLGLALAMDAFGAGIAVAMAGFNILFTAVAVGMLKFILVNSGMMLGRCVKNGRLKEASSLVTGCILIVIGICEFM